MKKFVCIILSLGLFGCAQQPDENRSAPPPPVTSIKVSLDNLSDALQVSEGRFLLSSETAGLAIQDEAGLRVIKPGQFEALGYLDDAFAVVDAERNALSIFELKGNKISERHVISVVGYQLKSFCGYRSPLDGYSYVYLLDGDGLVEQYLLSTGDGSVMQPVPVRHFHVGADVGSCVASAATRKVFFAEAQVGVFAYKAEPESDVKRELVAASQPAGQLPADFTAINFLADGNLMGIEEETNRLIGVASEPTGIAPQILPLNQVPEAEIEALHVSEGKLLAVDTTHSMLHILQAPGAATETPVAEAKVATVQAIVQTPPMRDTGDAADDPAIWIHPEDPAKSLVLGTNKKQGLLVYSLGGELLQTLAHGHVNNVDLRYGFTLKGKEVDIAASSNRSTNSISLYRIDRDTRFVSLLKDFPLTMKEPYGLCMGQKGDEISVWINDKSGLFEEFVLVELKGEIHAVKGRSFRVDSQPEGCVVDDVKQQLFVGEEDKGIWKVDLNKEEITLEPVMQVGDILVADVEGLSIARKGIEGKDVLVISSQGDNSYVLIETEAPYALIGKFRVGLNPSKGIDGVSETDGLTVSTHNFGGRFSGGLLVVQDGYNLMPNAAQNFKFISWDAVRASQLPLAK